MLDLADILRDARAQSDDFSRICAAPLPSHVDCAAEDLKPDSGYGSELLRKASASVPNGPPPPPPPGNPLLPRYYQDWDVSKIKDIVALYAEQIVTPLLVAQHSEMRMAMQDVQVKLLALQSKVVELESAQTTAADHFRTKLEQLEKRQHIVYPAAAAAAAAGAAPAATSASAFSTPHFKPLPQAAQSTFPKARPDDRASLPGLAEFEPLHMFAPDGREQVMTMPAGGAPHPHQSSINTEFAVSETSGVSCPSPPFPFNQTNPQVPRVQLTIEHPSISSNVVSPLLSNERRSSSPKPSAPSTAAASLHLADRRSTFLLDPESPGGSQSNPVSPLASSPLATSPLADTTKRRSSVTWNSVIQKVAVDERSDSPSRKSPSPVKHKSSSVPTYSSGTSVGKQSFSHSHSSGGGEYESSGSSSEREQVQLSSSMKKQFASYIVPWEKPGSKQETDPKLQSMSPVSPDDDGAMEGVDKMFGFSHVHRAESVGVETETDSTASKTLSRQHSWADLSRNQSLTSKRPSIKLDLGTLYNTSDHNPGSPSDHSILSGDKLKGPVRRTGSHPPIPKALATTMSASSVRFLAPNSPEGTPSPSSKFGHTYLTDDICSPRSNSTATTSYEDDPTEI